MGRPGEARRGLNRTVDRRETWNEGPPGTEVEGLAAAYRDRFSLKNAGAERWSGRRTPRAGHWCASSSESVDGSGGHSRAATQLFFTNQRLSKGNR